MAKHRATAGYSANGLPYTCFGNGTRNLVVFDGLDFRHKPPAGFMLRITYGYLWGLTDDYRIYIVSRRRGLPLGYSLRDMSDDCAVMIKTELGCAADIIGVSTGGGIAQYFAIDHPDLVKRLVLAMTGCCQTVQGKELLRRVADLALKRRRRAAYALLGTAIIRRGIMKRIFKWFMWLVGSFYIPSDPSDGIVEIEADERYDLSDQLHKIKADTLVIGGEEDFFYAIRDTAARIPNAKLVLYPNLGHNAMFARSRQFGEEIRAFLLG